MHPPQCSSVFWELPSSKEARLPQSGEGENRIVLEANGKQESSTGYGLPTKMFLFTDRSIITSPMYTASQAALVVKNPPANAGDMGWIPGWGRFPEKGHVNPLQYSCRENPTQRSLEGCSPRGHKESDTTEPRAYAHTCNLSSPALIIPADRMFRNSVGEGQQGGTETLCCVFPLLYHPIPSPPPGVNPCSTHNKVKPQFLP